MTGTRDIAERFSVGGYTTPGLSFAEDLRVYREAGAYGIGIDSDLKLRDPASGVEALRASGLKATHCFPSTPSVLPLDMVPGSTDLAARIEEMCEGVRRLAVLDPACVVCVTGPVGSYEPERAFELAIRGLRQTARVAAEVGLKLAIEPMHASIREGFSWINTIPDAISLIEAIGKPNVGIMFDVWHLWDTPNLLDHIAEHGAQIFGVQVDDWRNPTRSWCDRTLPGEGVADLPAILGALDAAGYQGWYELEIMSDDGRFGDDYDDSLWKLDPVELIRRGREALFREWNRRTGTGPANPAGSR